jgi:hypothetical protein
MTSEEAKNYIFEQMQKVILEQLKPEISHEEGQKLLQEAASKIIAENNNGLSFDSSAIEVNRETGKITIVFENPSASFWVMQKSNQDDNS